MRPYSAQWLKQYAKENDAAVANARRALAGTGLGSRNASPASSSRSSAS